MLGEVKVASALSADLGYYIKQTMLIYRGLPNGVFFPLKIKELKVLKANL